MNTGSEIKGLPISAFRVGDKVDVENGRFESEVGCIHERELYLRRDREGVSCSEHGNNWICSVKEGIVTSNGMTNRPLKLLKPRTIKWL